jgi:hypothetical protein
MVNPASLDLLAVASLLLRTYIFSIQKPSHNVAVADQWIAKTVVTRSGPSSIANAAVHLVIEF